MLNSEYMTELLKNIYTFDTYNDIKISEIVRKMNIILQAGDIDILNIISKQKQENIEFGFFIKNLIELLRTKDVLQITENEYEKLRDNSRFDFLLMNIQFIEKNYLCTFLMKYDVVLPLLKINNETDIKFSIDRHYHTLKSESEKMIKVVLTDNEDYQNITYFLDRLKLYAEKRDSNKRYQKCYLSVYIQEILENRMTLSKEDTLNIMYLVRLFLQRENEKYHTDYPKTIISYKEVKNDEDIINYQIIIEEGITKYVIMDLFERYVYRLKKEIKENYRKEINQDIQEYYHELISLI